MFKHSFHVDNSWLMTGAAEQILLEQLESTAEEGQKIRDTMYALEMEIQQYARELGSMERRNLEIYESLLRLCDAATNADD